MIISNAPHLQSLLLDMKTDSIADAYLHAMQFAYGSKPQTSVISHCACKIRKELDIIKKLNPGTAQNVTKNAKQTKWVGSTLFINIGCQWILETDEATNTTTELYIFLLDKTNISSHEIIHHKLTEKGNCHTK